MEKVYLVSYAYKPMNAKEWRFSDIQINANSIDECLQDAKNIIGALYKYYEITTIERKF